MADHRVLFCLCLVMFVGHVQCSPVRGAGDIEDGGELEMRQTLLQSFGDVTNFLRTWFRTLRERLQDPPENQSTLEPEIRARRAAVKQTNNETPDIQVNSKNSNESSFEDYERSYLLHQISNYLQQIYYYSKYQEEKHKADKTDTTQPFVIPTVVPVDSSTDSNRNDPILEAKMRELMDMPIRELDKLFDDVRDAARNGVVDPGITSLCCPMG